MIQFAKYEGAGNDFILIDNRKGIYDLSPKMIASLCHRHFGIGADGLMTLSMPQKEEDEQVVCQMKYYNSDGSLGEMCGNGARCFALFIHHLGLCQKECTFRATDGLHHAQLIECDEHQGMIEIGMKDVDSITSGDGWWALNTGVPHYVEFCEEPQNVDLICLGRKIRYDKSRFPQGTNVNFAAIEPDGHLRMRTYERGVEDETLACGTGATAVAIVAHHVFRHDLTQFSLSLPGGELFVRFDSPSCEGQYRNIHLKGPARRVFEGEITI